MSHYYQHQIPVAYPPPPVAAAYTLPQPQQAYTAYPPPPVQYPNYVAPPPPIGYLSTTTAPQHPTTVPVETKARGDDFWKGCCAALCCCCVLDFCF